MDKITEASLLYDFYGQLLTKRKQEVMELYHEENLTLNERGKWLVVEGNARPGGFGIQRSSGVGTRKDFFRVIGKHPNDFR